MWLRPRGGPSLGGAGELDVERVARPSVGASWRIDLDTLLTATKQNKVWLIFIRPRVYVFITVRQPNIFYIPLVMCILNPSPPLPPDHLSGNVDAVNRPSPTFTEIWCAWVAFHPNKQRIHARVESLQRKIASKRARFWSMHI